MTRPLLKHLDDVEIEALLKLSSARSEERGEPLTRLMDEARPHLAGCLECAQRLRMHRDGHEKLQSLRFAEAGEMADGCSESVDWIAVAAGILPGPEAQAYLRHAARCARCGVLLKTAVADLSDEITPEEEAILAGLKGSSVEWQLAMVQKLQSETATAPRRRRLSWGHGLRAPAAVFAAALLLLVTGIFVVLRTRHSDSASELVASAYAAHRTMDLRISGAAYAPKQVERGASSSNVDRPVPLLQAEALIHNGLLGNPSDADLLDAKARVDLLDGSPDAAVESLERARETKPDSHIFMTDLAAAYFMRAEKEDSAIDYGHAMDLLGKVLAASPDDPVALFNRALTEDRLLLYNDEIADWTRFIEVEKDSGWLSEGRGKLAEVRKRVDNHERSSWSPHQSAAAALSAIRLRAQASAGEDPDAPLDEVYLASTISQWLPAAALPERGPQQDPADDVSAQREASEAMADVLRVRHQDAWLSDLLAGPRSPPWATGIRELAGAARANSLGNVPETLAHASRAIQIFASIHNDAGESAARFEYLIGVNRSVRADRCRDAARDAIRSTALHSYPWIEANILFESSTCSFMIGKQEAALDDARQGELLARKAHYKVLQLLGAYFLDGVTTPSVATSDAWDRIQAALGEYWRFSYPPDAGEGFYSDLGFAAQDEGMWHCAEAVFRESVVIHSKQDDRFAIAGVHHRLAKAAEAAGDHAVAEQEYRKASEILTHLGNGVNLTRIELEIERAAMEVRQNKLQAAAGRLHAVEVDLPIISNHYALIPYLESVGELHLDTGKPQQAEKELSAAIRLIEQDKHSLRSQTDLLAWQHDTREAYRSLLRLYSQSLHDDSKAFSLLECYRAGPVRGGDFQEATEGNGRTEPCLSQFLPQRIEVRDHSAMLTWISFPNSLSVFLLDANGLHAGSVAVSEDTFDATTRRLIRLCSDPLSDRAVLDRDARQLYQWLVQPMAGYLKGTRELTIEPDDSFSAIPFEILESPQGEYLGDLYSIAESPGLGYARLLRTDSRISPASVALAVGDPQLPRLASSRFRPLPEAGSEAENVAAGFHRHFLLTGGKASLQNVVKLLPLAEVFHFAGHAASLGNETGLILSSPAGDPDRVVLLDAKQLGGEPLKKLKLVVLSGCETGIAEQGLVDPESLVRVFLRAGVPDVVASKWQIDSQSSAELMSQFYGSLMRGISIHEALSSARMEIRSNPKTAHPYYWAAFSVFGR